MEDLPAELTMDILSRLPVKTIIHCKRVCKKWRSLVSESSFVSFHLSKSSPTTTGFIFHQNVNHLYYHRIDPGILRWVEIEDKIVDDRRLHPDPPMNLDLNRVPIFQKSLISQMGSVNGLICLWQHSTQHDNTFICNPVTREIMILPSPRYHTQEDFRRIFCGFGFIDREYKVVRTFKRRIPLNGNQSYRITVFEAEVYTLGTCQWRNVGRVPYRLHGSHVPFLNDHFHWIVSNMEDALERICTFDLNTETFQLFPSPPSEAIQGNCIQSLAVLKGCLCKSDTGGFKFTIWVMKEYGIKKSWHKEMVITEVISKWPLWPYLDYIYLIGGLKDGTILLVSGTGGSLFAFYPRNNTIEEIETFDWLEGGMAYRPSFLKLQNFESERIHIHAMVRSLGRVPHWLDDSYQPFLNGHMHSHVKDEDTTKKLCIFNLDKETQSCLLTVLKSCLCQVIHEHLCEVVHDFKFTIWAMKEYGIKKSWHNEVVAKQGMRSYVD
ncbi:LOW QUALITY PROTEIN: hypothetical protein OSB04_015860 [Centaurea solstitialis]|uniref:F-box domain-containing protein n=1 Tax=Centaurea solstitialis TaxID=347529 RepID=A0AA38TBR9_9ASTR|nr:LOW QUALITY PROTEIN: hypothetical protein OSB04_015860 [Centaurea solstitialis]